MNSNPNFIKRKNIPYNDAVEQFGKYWHFSDPKINKCKHEEVEITRQGMLIVEQCTKCKMWFWPI